MKPYSDACEQNKEPILAVLRDVLADAHTVLEIGSGTGQHAVHFGAELRHLTWITSDLPSQHAGIRAWLAEAALPNVLPPLALDVAERPWPTVAADAVFSANTAHIVSWRHVESLFAGVGELLSAGGVFCLYGPFRYRGRHTSESNARFDAWLKARDHASGVRDFEALDALAQAHGMALLRDVTMPVNNRTLVWRKS
jgi:cyclopropane fatty-acyl-phospholipid synthase-like methyltransferase